jgi:hypothetical protein
MAPSKKADTIEFFGSADRNIKGEISSSVPAWMLSQHVEELQESVNMKERALKFNRIPAENRPYAEEELRAERERL